MQTHAAVVAVVLAAAGVVGCGGASRPEPTATLVNRITPESDGSGTTVRRPADPNSTPAADEFAPTISGTPPAVAPPGGQPGGGGPGDGGGPGVSRSNTPIAEFLGITEDELAAALQEEGATLASVAEVYGKSREQLKTFLIDDARARVAAEVEAGTMTQEEADEQIARFESDVDRIVDSSGGSGPVRPAPAQ